MFAVLLAIHCQKWHRYISAVRNLKTHIEQEPFVNKMINHIEEQLQQFF